MKLLSSIKITLVLIASALFAALGELALPVLSLISFMIVDYITGINAAEDRNQKVNSDISFKGIKKKIYQLGAVGLGVILDGLIFMPNGILGIQLTIQYPLALLITFWFIFNELISILENLEDIGVRIPSWFPRFAKNLHSKIEGKGDEFADGVEKQMEEQKKEKEGGNENN